MKETKNPKRKTDRRIARTRSALHQAQRELVNEKGYEAVTVDDIAERANVARTTFYLHYHDKEDLFLEDFEIKLFQQVDSSNERPLIRWLSKNENSIVYITFELVLENADLFRAITKAQSNAAYQKFRDIHNRAIMQLLEKSPVIKSRSEQINYPFSFILDYYSGALWAVIIWWVEHDFTPSISEVTQYFLNLYNPGLINALEVKNLEALLKKI